MLFREFLESSKSAKEFIEDAVTSAVISSVTDKPNQSPDSPLNNSPKEKELVDITIIS